MSDSGRRSRAPAVREQARRKPSEQRAMQAQAQQRDDCELKYLLSCSVRNSRGASGLKAHSFRSFAYRFSAALALPLAARRFVMSQVKRCAQAGSSTGE